LLLTFLNILLFKLRRDGVVTFVTERSKSAPLIRPTATSPRQLASLDGEDASSSSSDDAEDSAVCARGIPLSLGVNSGVTSEASIMSDEDDDENSTATEECQVGEDEVVSDGKVVFSTAYKTEDDELDTNDQANSDELASIMECLNNDQFQDEWDLDKFDERFIGVVGDREQLITIPKPKRVLSYNTLTLLNADVGRAEDSPKRLKCEHEKSADSPEPFVEFSLGAPALMDDMLDAPRTIRASAPFQMAALSEVDANRESPVVSTSSDEEEELDRQLGEELDDCDGFYRDGATPVPLLTPPASPLTVDFDGEHVQVCEWPSNLTIDSAMAAVLNEFTPISPRAMSPDSLPDILGYKVLRPSTNAAAKGDSSTLLTPLLMGIQVGIR
jgi:hypothetical protein